MRPARPYMLILLLLIAASCNEANEIDIYATTDLHGMLLPFDNTEGVVTDHSLANLASVVEGVGNENMILLDNGDILQGDPLTYYYNYVDTSGTHIVADILNYLGYDAATIGNHDIETGHAVYDKIRGDYKFPLLAANAVREDNGEPYFEPFTVIRKKGMKIAVMGLITPSVPNWLPEKLYAGIRFEDMVETAAKWMPVILEEKPDLVIGLFHSGVGREEVLHEDENSSLSVALRVPGFDLIIAGHDHNQVNKTITREDGSSVLILDGGSRASVLMHARAVFSRRSDGTVQKTVTGELIPMKDLPESARFKERFIAVTDTLNKYTSRVTGKLLAEVTTRDAYFGPSAFVDLIHKIQLDITGADISLTAPLSFDERINAGEIRVRDLFRIYRFENNLYTVNMTGTEIDRHLEHSYGMWINTMEDKDDYLLKYRLNDDGGPQLFNGLARFRHPPYNFDSAMGISYTVNVTRPEGDRVTITTLADGNAFYPDSTYSVAVNSYRANGGGGHFEAAGITHEVLPSRVTFSTERDLRYLMGEYFASHGEINPSILSSWKLIPEKWVSEAQVREMKLLFRD